MDYRDLENNINCQTFLFVKEVFKEKILLASADIYRPAAQEQLKVLAEETGSDFFNHNLSSASKIVDDSIDYAQKIYLIFLF